MDQNWQPAPPDDLGAHSPTDGSGHSIDGPPQSALPARGPGSLRRMVATAGLVIGLLTIGGVSVVAAASPAPTSSTPAASGSTGTTTHNCPNMGNGTSPNASTTPSG